GAGGADLEAERPAELIAERLLEGGAGGGVAELLETGAGWNLQDEEVRPGGVDACSLQEDGGSVGHASPLADEGFECGLRPAAALRCGGSLRIGARDRPCRARRSWRDGPLAHRGGFAGRG